MTRPRTRRGGPTAAFEPKLTEERFLQQIKALARIYHWATYHTRQVATCACCKRRGCCRAWAIAKGSDRGFPDLVLVSCEQGRVIFAELKLRHGRLGLEQWTWQAILRDCPGVEAFVWYPDQLDSIHETLRGPAAARGGQIDMTAPYTVGLLRWLRPHCDVCGGLGAAIERRVVGDVMVCEDGHRWISAIVTARPGPRGGEAG